jgi:hypothetical protein
MVVIARKLWRDKHILVTGMVKARSTSRPLMAKLLENQIFDIKELLGG